MGSKISTLGGSAQSASSLGDTFGNKMAGEAQSAVGAAANAGLQGIVGSGDPNAGNSGYMNDISNMQQSGLQFQVGTMQLQTQFSKANMTTQIGYGNMNEALKASKL